MIPLVISLSICLISAALEGLFSGRDVKRRFAELRFPAYSLKLQHWYVVGVLYYALCFIILFRLLKIYAHPGFRIATALIVLFMFLNAGWNYFFFRTRNLFYAFLTSAIYSVVALVLLFDLVVFDRFSAWVLLPYIAYLPYANIWGYRVWKLNR